MIRETLKKNFRFCLISFVVVQRKFAGNKPVTRNLRIISIIYTHKINIDQHYSIYQQYPALYNRFPASKDSNSVFLTILKQYAYLENASTHQL